MDFFRTLIYFVLGLSLLVLIHELGHYLFAKLFNVYCFEFSIGMGPKLYSKKVGETEYSIRAFPIGGFVLMAGESPTEELPTETFVNSETGQKETRSINIPFERTINGLNNFKKFLVIGAGVILNFILCFVLLIIVYTVDGAPSRNTNRIRITANSAAEKAGLRNDDFVVYISGQLIDSTTNLVVKSFDEKEYGFYKLDDKYNYVIVDGKYVEKEFVNYSTVIEAINPTKEAGQKQCITFKVKRDSSLTPITVCREISDTVKVSEGEYVVNKLGFEGVNNGTVKLKFGEALKFAGEVELSMASSIFVALGSIFSNFNQVGGPIAIFQAVDTFATEGFFYFLYFLAFISVNLGVVNLLPIPGLDGGRLILIIGESITRKKFPSKAEAIINTIGLYLLFGLMIIITLKDILGLF
jgi:regulator of sigma E protease